MDCVIILRKKKTNPTVFQNHKTCTLSNLSLMREWSHGEKKENTKIKR